VPSSQWDKLRSDSLPLLDNNVAVFGVDGSICIILLGVWVAASRWLLRRLVSVQTPM
jgi:hypothetical protein